MIEVNKALLQDWIARFRAAWEGEEAGGYDIPAHAAEHRRRVERAQRLLTTEHLPALTEAELRELLADTDALSFWSDQQRKLDEILADEGATRIRDALADLIAAAEQGLTVQDFRQAVDTPGLGRLFVSEFLAYRFPDRYWTYSPNVTLPAFQALGLDVKAALPRGQKGDEHIYLALREPMEQVVAALQKASFAEADYPFADMFLWFVKKEFEKYPSISLQWLVEILGKDVRDEQVIQRTNPFLEHIGQSLQERVGDLAWDTSLQHRDVKQPQYLNRAYARFPHSGLDLMVALLPDEIWWGLHKWGKKKMVNRLWDAFKELDLLEPGAGALVRKGDIGGWRGGAYFTMGHTLSAGEVLQFRSEDGLVEHIADELTLWFQRVSPYDSQIQAWLQAWLLGHRKVVLVGASSNKREEDDRWPSQARDLITRTGKAASWWSYAPDPEYVARLRESLPTWLYVSYGGHITQRQHVVDFVGPEDESIESPWPEHTPPEQQGRVCFVIPATGREHNAQMWFLLDRIEPVDPPLRPKDFEPVGKKYRRSGQNHFAFVYEPTNGPPPPPPSPIPSLSAHLSANGFHFPRHLLTTYYLSLQTKPFVILSGLSGTGKTKLAQLFAEFISPLFEREIEEPIEAKPRPDTSTLYVLCKRGATTRRVTVREKRAALIPVHPDWTDHRGLLGFHHLLTGAYHTTDFLRLLLRAYADEDRRPYFATLDEMNLARVEHYFADFLSVLESRRLRTDGRVHQDSLPLHDQPRCLLAAGNEALAEGFYTADADHKTCTVACQGCPFRDLVDEQHHRGEYIYNEAHRGGFDPTHFVPPCLEVPLNVYFTGTVNVDETTFTFSPKVLDRANVIEFEEVDLEGYWREVGQVGNLSPADEEIVRLFTHDFTYPFATGLREEAHREPALAPYRDQLAALVHLLEPHHLHFGYRLADEALVYLLNARRLNDSDFDLDAAFDHAVLQKILPRFHGSRARLWKPLLRLLAFCTGDSAAAAEKAKAWESLEVERIEGEIEDNRRLPHSAAKLRRMLRDLETEGFTSFT